MYFYFIKLGEKYLFYLTNGVESSQYYFSNPQFLDKIKTSFYKKVIQLNFTEKYQILETIGKGSFSNV